MQLILLRGLARESGHWLDFPTQLQHTLNGVCRILCIDFPGCGKYFQQRALTSVAAMTEHARTEIQTLITNNEPVYVLGISMGGMVALDWAQRYPHEVNGLVLINSSAGNQPLWWRLRPAAWPSMIKALLSDSRTRETRVIKLVSNQPRNNTQHLKQWLQIQQARPVTRTTIITMLRCAAAFQPQSTCAVAGLVLASEQDRMVSVRASKAIAEQFVWPIQIHPTAGHDLPMDDPQWLAQQIAHWLQP